MTSTDNTHDLPRTDAARQGPGRDDRGTVFAVLADPRCRTVVRRLAKAGSRTVTVDDLAAGLAAADDSLDADRATTLLHHSVLPRLADVGYVDRDVDRGTVQYEADDLLERSLAAVDEIDAADLAVSAGTLLDVLADGRRRCALRTLLTHRELTLPDLADEVAVEERGKPLSEIDPDTVLGVYLSLYHTHVPRLTDADLAAYEQEHDLVAATESGEALATRIETLCEL